MKSKHATGGVHAFHFGGLPVCGPVPPSMFVESAD